MAFLLGARMKVSFIFRPAAFLAACLFGFAGAVAAPSVASVSAAPHLILGGQSATGTVVLTEPAPAGGQVVDIDANIPVTVPSTVTVPQGATSQTFTITGQEHRIPRLGVISAGIGGVWQTTPFTVRPSVLQISTSPLTVTGGVSVSVTVRIGEAAPEGGAVVALEADRGVTLPATVIIPEGNLSATVTASTPSLSASTTSTVYARRGGVIAWTGLLMFPPRISSIVVSPSMVDPGDAIVGTINLDAPAPVEGLRVTLTRNRPQVSVPGSVLVPAGQTSATFNITATGSPSLIEATIIGAANGFRKFAVLRVRPVILTSVTLASPGAAVNGRIAGTLTLSGNAPSNLNVTLTSTPPGLTHPATVTIPSGSRSESFVALVPSNPNATRAHTFYATLAGRVRSAGVTVYTTAPQGTHHESLPGLTVMGQPALFFSASSRSKPVKIVGGIEYATILREDGSAESQGFLSRFLAPIPQSDSVFRDISGPFRHTLFVRANGTVTGVGDNTSNQLTNSVSGAVKVAAGEGFSLALRADGTVVGWGMNNFGQASPPTGLSEVIDIVAGRAHALALTSNGAVVAWGTNSSGQTNVPIFPFPVKQIAAGDNHSLALMSNGIVVAWGLNSFGQATPPTVPVQMIAAGGNSSLAWQSGSTFIGWGDGSVGQLVPPPNSRPVISLTLSYRTGGYVLDDGTVRIWGNFPMQTYRSSPMSGVVVQAEGNNGWFVARDDQGFVSAYGFPGNVVVPPSPISGAIEVSAGRRHGAALLGDGAISTWGDNSDNQIPVPAGVAPARSVLAIAHNTAAIRMNGTVAVWGANASGQTNIPFGLDRVVQIVGGPGPNIGTGYFVALRSNGTVVAWGDNFYGQRGVPSGLSNVVKLAARVHHIVALRSDGTVAAWGSNAAGATNVPVGLNGVVDIAVGNGWTAALRSNGQIVMWGQVTLEAWAGPTPDQRYAALVSGANAMAALHRAVVLPRHAHLGHNQGSVVDLTFPIAPRTDTVVSLTATPALVTLPPTVLIRAGQRSVQFTVTSSGGFEGTAVINATVDGRTYTGSISVTPSEPVLTLVEATPSAVNGGSNFELKLTIAPPARAGGAIVSLSSNQAGHITLPATVTIPAGQTTSTISGSTTTTSVDRSATITARTGGAAKTAVLTVIGPRPQDVTLAANSVRGGASSSFDVSLDLPAPTGGMNVDIWSSRPEVILPGNTLAFSFGETSRTVPFSTASVISATPITIFARANGRTRLAVVNVTP